MASPAPVYGSGGGFYGPPPRRQSLVGPLILIALGVLFLLRNFGYTIPLFHNFVRYWPLLLVAVGAVRLAEFFAARRSQNPVPRMGGGTVFLLLLVIAAGMGLSALFGHNEFHWGPLRDHVRSRVWDDADGDDDLAHLFGNQYTYDGELTQPLAPGGTVRVNSERGSIAVNHWDQPQVKVVYHKRIFAGSQSDADSLNRSTAPHLQAQGAALEVQANTEAAGAKGVACDLELYVPVKADVDLTARRGDVSVSQRTGDVKVNAQHGDVTVDDVAGIVNVTTRKGSLHAANITGNLTADGRLDDIALESIQGTVFVGADIFGDARLSKLQKGVTIRTSRTNLQIARLDGDLAMDSGDLQAQGLQGPFSLSTKAKDVNLRNLKGDIHIEDDTGDIDLESTSVAALGNVDLTTHHGDVHLRLPAKANFQYQVVTRHGDIASDFETLQAENLSGAATASGKVGKGGVKISVTSDTGDIEISKAATSRAEPMEPPEAPSKPSRPEKPGKRVGDVEVM